MEARRSFSEKTVCLICFFQYIQMLGPRVILPYFYNLVLHFKLIVLTTTILRGERGVPADYNSFTYV